MMDAYNTQQCDEVFGLPDFDGVDECLQKLRNHLLDLRRNVGAKDKQIELLQERCRKLKKVVTLQQRDLLAKTKAADAFPDRRHGYFAEYSVSSSNATDFCSASKLNMAFDSQELFDSSSLSPYANERIAETENIRSPRIFVACPKGREVGNTPPSGLKEHNSNMDVAGGMRQKSGKWLSKESPKQPENWGSQLLRPKIEQKKVTSLSLSKRGSSGKNKTKQTKLQNTTLTQCKSWTLRTDKRDNREQVNRCSSTVKPVKAMSDSEEDVIVFSSPVSSSKQPEALELRLQSISGSKNPVLARHALFACASNSDDTASVVEIPAPTQDIIFIDDTVQELPVSLEEVDFNAVANKCQNKVKYERVTQPEEEMETDAETTRLSDAADYESAEELMVRPILIKEEKRRSAVERFPTSCMDCKMYLQIFGDKKSDQEISAHLAKCLHNLRPSTPEGFWNPLMVSFPEGDPRNETLIDMRFVGNKR